ncbi:glycosyltransferase [Pyxidicoccus sp. 3LFB2]
MRILHLLASPAFSGPAENIALLALAQRELGHEASVAVDRKRSRLSSEELAVPRFQALGLLDEGGLELSVKSFPWAMAADALRLRRRAVDVVHAHFSHDHLLASVGCPPGARLVRSIHAPRSLGRWLPRADAFTVPSEEDLQRLGRPGALVLPPLTGAEFVPPGDRVALRRTLGIEGHPVIGMVSTFQPSRRHDVGLEAFARLLARTPGALLVLVGDGECEPALRAQAERLGISARVLFAGYRGGEDFVRWLQALDEVWVLGLGNDWSGRVAAQARRCGVRVIAARLGGLPRYADVILDTVDAEAVVAAARQGGARTRELETNLDIARQVLRLYEGAAGRAGA